MHQYGALEGEAEHLRLRGVDPGEAVELRPKISSRRQAERPRVVFVRSCDAGGIVEAMKQHVPLQPERSGTSVSLYRTHVGVEPGAPKPSRGKARRSTPCGR
jgi:hypothetical protein